VSKKNVPAANLKELIAWLKANESKAAAGTAGAGSASQIAEIYFQKITGTRFGPSGGLPGGLARRGGLGGLLRQRPIPLAPWFRKKKPASGGASKYHHDHQI
jgi:hypothetical protein